MIDLLSLPYPMFATTAKEKEILRKCELYYAEHLSGYMGWVGLCRAIDLVEYENLSASGHTLLDKISNSLPVYWYLHSYLGGKIDYDFTHTNYEVKNTLRRIWITKLLAYEGE